jgi:hypothetical protein
VLIKSATVVNYSSQPSAVERQQGYKLLSVVLYQTKVYNGIQSTLAISSIARFAQIGRISIKRYAQLAKVNTLADYQSQNCRALCFSLNDAPRSNVLQFTRAYFLPRRYWHECCRQEEPTPHQCTERVAVQ